MVSFNDGVQLDTNGPLRVVNEQGAFYVVGEGACYPVDDENAGRDLIRSIESRTVFMNMKVFKSPGSRYRASAAVAEALEERGIGADGQGDTGNAP